MTQADSTKAATRSWLGREQRAGRAAARPVLMLHILGTVLGVAQAFLAASVLASAFAATTIEPVTLTVFGLLAVLRAAVSYLTERAAFVRWRGIPAAVAQRCAVAAAASRAGFAARASFGRPGNDRG